MAVMTVSPGEQRKQVRVANRLGLHARPAAEFVKLANRFSSDILVTRDEIEVNGKSIMGMMMLAAEQGVELEIRAKGDDAGDALSALAALVERGFGEDS
jgi:phosphocarrier protein